MKLLTPLNIFAFIVAVTALDVTVLEPKAVAEPKPGLYWETGVSGPAHVRRLRDTSNGVVCYVAHGDDTWRTTAISCVKL